MCHKTVLFMFIKLSYNCHFYQKWQFSDTFVNVIGNFLRKHFPHKTIINVSKYDFWHINDSFMGKMFPQEVSHHIHKCVWKLSFLIEMTVIWEFYEHEKNSFLTHLWKETHLGEVHESLVTVLWHIYGNDRFMTIMW